jgi:hypothetical protein
MLLGVSFAFTQESASYRLNEHVLNAGGQPAAGSAAASASYTITFGSVGEGLAAVAPSSASFQLAGGFVAPYPPPGEVAGVILPASTTVTWGAEASAGTYNVYRDALTTLPALGYGVCDQQGLTTTSAAAGPNPPARAGYFYLVTVENRLGEEGTKGFRTGPVERTGSACP